MSRVSRNRQPVSMAEFELAPVNAFLGGTGMKTPSLKTLIMAVLALTISSAAKAQKTSDIINSGDDFLAVCQYDNNRPPDVCRRGRHARAQLVRHWSAHLCPR
jgi:hypothetical protein